MSQKQQFNLPIVGYNDSFDAIKNISGLVLALDYRYGVYTDTAMTTPAAIGDGVGGWRNRATDAYHATQGTAANKPILTADGLQFDGSNDYMAVARMTGQFGVGFTYCVVASKADGRPAGVTVFFGGLSTTTARRYFTVNNQTSGNIDIAVSSDTGVTTTLTTLADGAIAPAIYSVTGNPTANLTAYLNGTQSGTPSALSGLTWANIATAHSEAPFLGATNLDGSPTAFEACTIKSVIIYNRPLSTTELLVIHRYLGHAHGVAVP